MYSQSNIFHIHVSLISKKYLWLLIKRWVHLLLHFILIPFQLLVQSFLDEHQYDDFTKWTWGVTNGSNRWSQLGITMKWNEFDVSSCWTGEPQTMCVCLSDGDCVSFNPMLCRSIQCCLARFNVVFDSLWWTTLYAVRWIKRERTTRTHATSCNTHTHLMLITINLMVFFLFAKSKYYITLVLFKIPSQIHIL